MKSSLFCTRGSCKHSKRKEDNIIQCGQIQNIGWESKPNRKFTHPLKIETTSTRCCYRFQMTGQVTPYLLGVSRKNEKKYPYFLKVHKILWSRIKLISEPHLYGYFYRNYTYHFLFKVQRLFSASYTHETYYLSYIPLCN